MTKQAKIDDLVAAWIDGADLDTIYEFAEEKYAEWLVEQTEDFITETHKEFCDWVEPEAFKKVIET